MATPQFANGVLISEIMFQLVRVLNSPRDSLGTTVKAGQRNVRK